MLTDPARCTRYRLGHGLDLVEAKLAWRYAVRKPVPCRLLDFQENGMVQLLDEDGRHYEVWNHNPQKLIQLASRSDVQVSIAPFNRHLRVFSGGRWYAISFCSEVDRTPCDFSPA
jgi:hypothetical protein